MEAKNSLDRLTKDTDKLDLLKKELAVLHEQVWQKEQQIETLVNLQKESECSMRIQELCDDLEQHKGTVCFLVHESMFPPDTVSLDDVENGTVLVIDHAKCEKLSTEMRSSLLRLKKVASIHQEVQSREMIKEQFSTSAYHFQQIKDGDFECTFEGRYIDNLNLLTASVSDKYLPKDPLITDPEEAFTDDDFSGDHESVSARKVLFVPNWFALICQ